MTDLLLGTGTLGLTGGSLSTTPLYYVLTVRGDQPSVTFGSGSADFYHLGPARLFGRGQITLGTHGSVGKIYTDPLGSFDDFAIYPYDGSYTGQDPSDLLVTADNTGTHTAGVGNTWSRHYRVFYPPRGARFVVPHIALATIPAGVSQYLDAHQMEVLNTSVNAPSAFGSARSLRVNIRPTRLNLSQNPNGYLDTARWTGVTKGAASGFSCTGSATHTVANLVPGTRYTVSAKVSGSKPITINGVTQVLSGRQWATFRATAVAMDITFASTAAFTIKQVLVTEGTVAYPYFDGNTTGPDYLWEQGSTPGAGRSYYYQDRTKRHFILMRTLKENAPLGIKVEDPQYAKGIVGIGPYGLIPYGSGLYGG